ncbi:MAG: hypothetical protein JXR83_22515 [Deltaproteobacteria bacterium]|nr:hypothetical protein [Deltaproteobacteria bacterium]
MSSEACRRQPNRPAAWIALAAAWLLPLPLAAQAGTVALALEPGYRWNSDDPNHPHAAAVGAEADVGITRLVALRLTSTLYQAAGVATAEMPDAGTVTGGEAGAAVVVLVDLLDAWLPTIAVHALVGYAPALTAGSEDPLAAVYFGMGAGIGLDYRVWDPCTLGVGVRYSLLNRSTDIGSSELTTSAARGTLDVFLRLSLRLALF